MAYTGNGQHSAHRSTLHTKSPHPPRQRSDASELFGIAVGAGLVFGGYKGLSKLLAKATPKAAEQAVETATTEAAKTAESEIKAGMRETVPHDEVLSGDVRPPRQEPIITPPPKSEPPVRRRDKSKLKRRLYEPIPPEPEVSEPQSTFDRLREEMHSPEGRAKFDRLREEMNSPEAQATFQRIREEMSSPEGQARLNRLRNEMNIKPAEPELIPFKSGDSTHYLDEAGNKYPKTDWEDVRYPATRFSGQTPYWLPEDVRIRRKPQWKEGDFIDVAYNGESLFDEPVQINKVLQTMDKHGKDVTVYGFLDEGGYQQHITRANAFSPVDPDTLYRMIESPKPKTTKL